VGRLTAGATVDEVQARFDVLAARLHAAYPQDWTDVHRAARRITVIAQRQAGLMPEIRGSVVSFLTILGAVAVLVLLICCANLANLLMTRAAGRTREIAVRAAVGATRARIVRQMLTESLLLASLGGLCGVLLGAATGALLMRFQPPIAVPIVLDLSPNARTLAFAAVLSALTGLILGTLPALRATRSGAAHGLHHDALTPSHGRRLLTLRNTLVVGQVAISSALLVVTGLFV
ncbi:MAG TPA: FtsX-like permease family protein, partial [Gammaproteobacteria bacterium]|nr:FtsX-like permease family protein [Gammaproteobacteria bacterium]